MPLSPIARRRHRRYRRQDDHLVLRRRLVAHIIASEDGPEYVPQCRFSQRLFACVEPTLESDVEHQANLAILGRFERRVKVGPKQPRLGSLLELRFGREETGLVATRRPTTEHRHDERVVFACLLDSGVQRGHDVFAGRRRRFAAGVRGRGQQVDAAGPIVVVLAGEEVIESAGVGLCGRPGRDRRISESSDADNDDIRPFGRGERLVGRKPQSMRQRRESPRWQHGWETRTCGVIPFGRGRAGHQQGARRRTTEAGSYCLRRQARESTAILPVVRKCSANEEPRKCKNPAAHP